MRSIKIILPGPLRTKKNSRDVFLLPSKVRTGIFGYFGYGRFRKLAPAMAFPRPGKAYLEWEIIARNAIVKQRPKDFVLFTGPISVNAQIFYKGNKPDSSGAYEAIGDCLQKYIFENDTQIEHWDGSRRIHCKDNPRTEILIQEIE